MSGKLILPQISPIVPRTRLLSTLFRRRPFPRHPQERLVSASHLVFLHFQPLLQSRTLLWPGRSPLREPSGLFVRNVHSVRAADRGLGVQRGWGGGEGGRVYWWARAGWRAVAGDLSS